MEFAYLFIHAIFDIFDTLLFQYFWAALLVSVVIPLGFAFLSSFGGDD